MAGTLLARSALSHGAVARPGPYTADGYCEQLALHWDKAKRMLSRLVHGGDAHGHDILAAADLYAALPHAAQRRLVFEHVAAAVATAVADAHRCKADVKAEVAHKRHAFLQYVQQQQWDAVEK